LILCLGKSRLHVRVNTCTRGTVRLEGINGVEPALFASPGTIPVLLKLTIVGQLAKYGHWRQHAQTASAAERASSLFTGCLPSGTSTKVKII